MGDASQEKASLANLIMTDHKADMREQSFTRSFGAKPCKPLRDPHPKVHLMVVVLVITLFVGLGIYFLVRHQMDKNKPHTPPKNMPMRVIEGQKVYQ